MNCHRLFATAALAATLPALPAAAQDAPANYELLAFMRMQPPVEVLQRATTLAAQVDPTGQANALPFLVGSYLGDPSLQSFDPSAPLGAFLLADVGSLEKVLQAQSEGRDASDSLKLYVVGLGKITAGSLTDQHLRNNLQLSLELRDGWTLVAQEPAALRAVTDTGPMIAALEEDFEADIDLRLLAAPVRPLIDELDVLLQQELEKNPLDMVGERRETLEAAQTVLDENDSPEDLSEAEIAILSEWFGYPTSVEELTGTWADLPTWLEGDFALLPSPEEERQQAFGQWFDQQTALAYAGALLPELRAIANLGVNLNFDPSALEYGISLRAESETPLGRLLSSATGGTVEAAAGMDADAPLTLMARYDSTAVLDYTQYLITQLAAYPVFENYAASVRELVALQRQYFGDSFAMTFDPASLDLSEFEELDGFDDVVEMISAAPLSIAYEGSLTDESAVQYFTSSNETATTMLEGFRDGIPEEYAAEFEEAIAVLENFYRLETNVATVQGSPVHRYSLDFGAFGKVDPATAELFGEASLDFHFAAVDGDLLLNLGVESLKDQITGRSRPGATANLPVLPEGTAASLQFHFQPVAEMVAAAMLPEEMATDYVDSLAHVESPALAFNYLVGDNEFTAQAVLPVAFFQEVTRLTSMIQAAQMESVFEGEEEYPEE